MPILLVFLPGVLSGVLSAQQGATVAAGVPDLSGEWTGNPSKTVTNGKPAAAGDSVETSLLRITHAEPTLVIKSEGTYQGQVQGQQFGGSSSSELHCTTDGQPGWHEVKYKNNGLPKPSEGTVRSSATCRWEGSVLVQTTYLPDNFKAPKSKKPPGKQGSGADSKVGSVLRMWLANGGMELVAETSMDSPVKLNVTAVYDRKFTAADAAKARGRAAESVRAALRQVVQASSEPKPFTSIKGAFDVNGVGNRSWKTSVNLPTGVGSHLERMTENGGETWVYVGLFPPSPAESLPDVYAWLADLVPTATGGNVEPIPGLETPAVMIRSDANSPMVVLLREQHEVTLAVLPAGVSPSTIHQGPLEIIGINAEIDQKLKGGNYQKLAPPVIHKVDSLALSGQAETSLENGTPYTLHVLMDGPQGVNTNLRPGEKRSLPLAPGSYRMWVEALGGNVMPLYRADDYHAGSSLEHHFVIE